MCVTLTLLHSLLHQDSSMVCLDESGKIVASVKGTDNAFVTGTRALGAALQVSTGKQVSS